MEAALPQPPRSALPRPQDTSPSGDAPRLHAPEWGRRRPLSRASTRAADFTPPEQVPRPFVTSRLVASVAGENAPAGGATKLIFFPC
jgi:hypothetical protein